MNRLNRLHAEQQQVCSSIWGQQLRTSGHQTESSSVLQEDRIYPSMEVVAPKRTNASPYNSRADTQALPHEATCRPASGSTTKGSRTKGSTTKGSRQKVHDRRFTTKRSRHKVHDKRFTTKGSRQKVHRRKVHKDSIEIDFLDGNNACFTANEDG